MTQAHDIFFSYRKHDLNRARPLLAALRYAGIRVWRDEHEIPDQSSITQEIREAIAGSKALLAFYSATYPLSSPCQQEITIAWLAAQNIDRDAGRRVWIVNPEAGFEHIPPALGDRQAPRIHAGRSNRALARSFQTKLDALSDDFLGAGVVDLPAYHGMSPVQARSFVGRTSELWELHGKLTANQIGIITGVYGQATAQVRGLGGNGKSLLAREYSIRFGPAYPGGVFWLNAYGNDDSKGPLSAEQRIALRNDQIRQFAVESGVSTEGLNPDEVEASFWQTIEKRGARCLWIVDDVPSGLKPDELERAWNARAASAATLITTRSKEYGARGDALDLGVLLPSEAYDLLSSQRKPEAGVEEAAARQIAELLGGHALAVAVAGSYLAQGFEGFGSYLTHLEKSGTEEDAVEFGALLQESLPTGHERSIRATFLRSILHFGQQAEMLDFLRLASILAVAPIEVSFVAEVFWALDPSDNWKNRALKAVNQATVLSLCEKSGNDARAVHTLVSRTMRFQFPDEKRRQELKSATVKALMKRLEVGIDIREHAKIAEDMPHARHIVGHLQTEDETELALWVAGHDYERGDYATTRKLEEQAVKALRRLLGEEHPRTMTAKNNLAETLRAQGDLTGAHKLAEQVMEASCRVLGNEHSDTLTTMGIFAGILSAQGDLAGSRRIEEKILEARRRQLGEEHRDTLLAILNLAGTLYAQGELEGARKFQEKSLAGFRRLVGETHKETLGAMHNLAMTLCQQGDREAARKLQQQVFETYRSLMGEEHPDTLLAMNNLAQTLFEQRNLEEALKFQKQVITTSRKVLGESHPNTLLAMNNLSQTLFALEDREGARQLLEQVVEVSYSLLGENHPNTLLAMNNLALTLDARDDPEGVLQLQERVAEASNRLLGKNHPNTLNAMNNFAHTLSNYGDRKRALKLQEQVVRTSRRALGEDHYLTLTAMGNLAVTLFRGGDATKARKLQERVEIRSRRVLGEDHPFTRRAMSNLADMT
ncbi:MAG TPA: tetratricopeptide repeat protein [Silvibacterium sp.]|nr:tetratricopeptide repeat protein [Silvibacterium sp.]